MSNDLERRRQGSVLLYRLSGADREAGLDGDIDQLLRLTRDLTGAQEAALLVIDGQVQVLLATTRGAAGETSPRADGICWNILRDWPGQAVFSTPDVMGRPDLQADPLVHLSRHRIRALAAAPLIGREGVALGLLCAWSGHPRSLTPQQLLVLGAMAKAVLLSLDHRRRELARHPNRLPSVERSASSPASSAPTRRVSPAKPASPQAMPTRAHADIGQIIDGRLVRTLFQPVVHLSTGLVVGFEALSRGPQGTDLEAPNALLDAARSVGRLGELDWICRSAALQAALDSRLHPSLSWFINVEPAGLACLCPVDLEPVQARARSRLRVVLELTERGANGYVTHLLEAAKQARASAWGVSLDDVGTESMSLALLPLLQPDVVKLDMRMLGALPVPSVAAVIAAVRAYAEASGAVILAESLETEEQWQLALVFGATYGQGYRYGVPAALPASVSPPREPIPLHQAPDHETGLTPFELVSAERPTVRMTKNHLMVISEHLERQGRQGIDSSVLMTCFQRAEFFTNRRREEYLAHAAVFAFTVAVGRDFPEQLTPRYQTASLLPGNRLALEWIVLVFGPHYAGALLARDCGDLGSDAARRFDVAYTHDRRLVVLAARSFLHHLGNPEAARPKPVELVATTAPLPVQPAPHRSRWRWQ